MTSQSRWCILMNRFLVTSHTRLSILTIMTIISVRSSWKGGLFNLPVVTIGRVFREGKKMIDMWLKVLKSSTPNPQWLTWRPRSSLIHWIRIWCVILARGVVHPCPWNVSSLIITLPGPENTFIIMLCPGKETVYSSTPWPPLLVYLCWMDCHCGSVSFFLNSLVLSLVLVL